MNALYVAALFGDEQTVRRELAANPQAALEGNARGWTALHAAAANGKHRVVAALLAASPSAAAALSTGLWTPLHVAAQCGYDVIVQQLLDARPGAALAPAADGSSPLSLALGSRHIEAARCLVRAAPTVQPTLALLSHAGEAAAALFADLARRLPLTQEEWRAVPTPCPDLARALPVVLARSAAEAGWLVGRLAEGQRKQLRTAAVCLHRATPLPAELAEIILARCLSPR